MEFQIKLSLLRKTQNLDELHARILFFFSRSPKILKSNILASYTRAGLVYGKWGYLTSLSSKVTQESV